MVGFAPASAHSTLQAGHSKLLLTTLEEIIQLQIKEENNVSQKPKQMECHCWAIRCRSSTYLEWSPNTNQLLEKCSKHKQKSVELEFPFSPLKMYSVFLLHLLKF
ncbi:hypothetical protein SETIT_7G303300v2 [Setaria italica]|uniref:Uncharacterized protein n=1 Tax=Setaria italica TaxID=4555 RepID=A0A368S1G4_SETIT|nr:hypothetical protein SETIT_7G303300v2 [Setaria italica]